MSRLYKKASPSSGVDTFVSYVDDVLLEEAVLALR